MDRQPLGACAVLLGPLEQARHRLLGTGDHGGPRPVQRGDADVGAEAVQEGPRPYLGQRHGRHRAAGRQVLHQPAACGDQRRRVRQGEHPGHVGGRHRADGVPEQDVGADTPALEEPVEGGLQREKGGLSVAGAVQEGRVVGEHDVLQRAVEMEVQGGARLVERRREDRLGGVEFTSHGGPLAALPGEQERRARLPRRDGRPRGVPGRQGGQRRHRLFRVAGHERGPVVQGGPSGCQGVGRRPQVGRGARGEEPAEARGLFTQCPRGPGGEREDDGAVVAVARPRPGSGRFRRRGRFARLRRLGLFEDDVRVGAADPEGGDGRPAGAVLRGPGAFPGQQLDGAGGPVHVRGGFVGVEAARQCSVPHRHHHLDDSGDPRRGLGVPDVGLHGPQEQRAVLGALLTVGRQQRLRLDRVPQPGAGAVGLDGVDVGRCEACVGEGLADDAFLGGAVGRGQPVAGAVLVDRGAAQHRQHLVAVAAGVGQPLHQQQPHALRPAGPVGPGGERLAPPVRRESPLTAELHERRRTRHHRDPTGQRQIALTAPQRLRRQVQRDQRRRARRVHRHRRPLQTERVRHPTGRHAARAAADQVPLGLLRGLRRLVQPGAVVAVHDAGEDAGARAAQRGGGDPRPLEGLPRGLQQQPLLRIGGQGLTGAHPEELRVEVARVVQEAPLTGVGAADGVRVGVVQRGQVPAPVRGEGADGVRSGADELPQVLR